MKLLKSSRHPGVTDEGTRFSRRAARGIILRGEEILLLYTERYQDYSLPGGGVDEGETLEQGLRREVFEETGVDHLREISPFGLYEELRPWHRGGFDTVHMLSYCFVCRPDPKLSDISLQCTQLEDYELGNGMCPVWINIHEALAHNRHILATSDKCGMSIVRETYLLQLIVARLLRPAVVEEGALASEPGLAAQS
ncbi:NUDIX domain-containing protein [Shewanella sp. AS16]|uniref:NUDIX hydrolase n=1 Tax=Shewanella sp. AS16 TaxID=2907625 RepID=UPI001F3F7135|nr:NUDIX domain-containing protein [Shewanella sp. AS16]MCE9687220.1 NUDIX domain-containing protein [Shewanella sp. AS16]